MAAAETSAVHPPDAHGTPSGHPAAPHGNAPAPITPVAQFLLDMHAERAKAHPNTELPPVTYDEVVAITALYVVREKQAHEHEERAMWAKLHGLKRATGMVVGAIVVLGLPITIWTMWHLL